MIMLYVTRELTSYYYSYNLKVKYIRCLTQSVSKALMWGVLAGSVVGLFELLLICRWNKNTCSIQEENKRI